MNPDPLVQLRDWSLVRRTAVGDVSILEDIDLDIRPGQWLAVLGANGSGKSSLLKYLASDESPVADSAAIMFQDPDDQIFAASVERELALGRPPVKTGVNLAEFGLAGLELKDPRLLSAGQKQRLVLAVALSLEPGLLLCDEPTSLQDPQQSIWVLDCLKKWLTETGGSLVTATCDRAEALRADWLIVLDEGKISCQGPAADLLETPHVIALLGRETRFDASEIQQWKTGGRPTLELKNLKCRFEKTGLGFEAVNLTAGAGQRIGITGPNGCGKSTLLAVCAGARRPDGGTVSLGGRHLYGGKSRDLEHGGAMIAPQFPEYLFTRATVGEEISLDPVLAGRDATEFLAHLGLGEELLTRNPHDLSSGQRRRLALGLVLHSRRPVLLLDEPTAALDLQGRQMVLELLDRIPAETTLLIASHDAAFLRAAGCRPVELRSHGLIDPGESVT